MNYARGGSLTSTDRSCSIVEWLFMSELLQLEQDPGLVSASGGTPGDRRASVSNVWPCEMTRAQMCDLADETEDDTLKTTSLFYFSALKRAKLCPKWDSLPVFAITTTSLLSSFCPHFRHIVFFKIIYSQHFLSPVLIKTNSTLFLVKCVFSKGVRGHPPCLFVEHEQNIKTNRKKSRPDVCTSERGRKTQKCRDFKSIVWV